MEVPKIKTKKIGHIHLIITANNFSLLNVPSVTLTSSAIDFGPITKPTRIHVKNATIGIITLLLIKSNASRIDIPSGAMWLQIPNPKEDGIPISNANAVTRRQVNFLPQPVLSRMIETIVSIKEIEDVRAAKNTNMKNVVPINPPIGMLLNTFGSVMNISPGPAFKFSAVPPEKANTAGITISPAKKAITVSKISI